MENPDTTDRGESRPLGPAAMNPFAIYDQGIIPAATRMTSYPPCLRNPHDWDVFYCSLCGLEIARAVCSPGSALRGPGASRPQHHPLEGSDPVDRRFCTRDAPPGRRA